MEMNFCRRCGTTLHHTTGQEYRCENDHRIYSNPAPTSGVFLITPTNHVVMAVRGVEPHIGMLDTFGGYINLAETAESGLARELQEELGLAPSDYETPTYLTSAYSSYSLGGEEHAVLGSFFWARLLTDRTLQPADDVAGVHIAAIDEIDSNSLHDDDIRTAFAELRRIWPSVNR